MVNGEMVNGSALDASNGPKIKLTLSESLKITNFMEKVHFITMTVAITRVNSARINVTVLARVHGQTVLSILATGNLERRMALVLRRILMVRSEMDIGARANV